MLLKIYSYPISNLSVAIFEFTAEKERPNSHQLEQIKTKHVLMNNKNSAAHNRLLAFFVIPAQNIFIEFYNFIHLLQKTNAVAILYLL